MSTAPVLIRTQEEAMRAEAVAWRRAIRTGERGRPTVVHCIAGCDVLGTSHAKGCWFDYAVGRVYELERALGA